MAVSPGSIARSTRQAAPPRSGSARRRGRAPTALCLADLHSSVKALSRLDQRLARTRGHVDLVLAAGDITIPGHEAYADEFIHCVARHEIPLLLVHGNNDCIEAVERFRAAGVTIHRLERRVLGHRFVGFGGDGNAPYDVELEPGELEVLPVEGAILLTHVPPATRLALSPVDGEHVTASLTFGTPPAALVGTGPLAHICGHIHPTEGVAYLAGTKVVKLRAAMWNRCALLNLSTLRAEFLDLEPGD